MMPYWRIALGVAAVWVYALWPRPAASEPTPLSVALVGNSITAGCCATQWEPAGPSWADQVATRRPAWQVTNYGVPGSTAFDWQKGGVQELYDRIEFPVDVVMISLGTVDLNRFENLQAPVFGAQLQQLEVDLLADGAGLVCVSTPFHPPFLLTQPEKDLRAHAFRLVVQQRFPCGADLFGLPHGSFPRAEDYHPGSEGHTAISHRIEDAIAVPEPDALQMAVAFGIGMGLVALGRGMNC